MNDKNKFCISLIKYYLKKGLKYNAKRGEMFYALDNISCLIKQMEEINKNDRK